MPTAAAKFRSGLRGRGRGQAFPLLAVMLLVSLFVGGLLLDGTLLFQTHADLETIARHAAKTGAQVVDEVYYNSNCKRPQSGNCEQFLRILSTGAVAADRSASAWLVATKGQYLHLPVQDPSTLAISSTVDVGGRSITVTITQCYQHYIFNPWFMDKSGPCANIGTAVTADFVARPTSGY